MPVHAGTSRLSTKDLESWLSKTFVPIEPSEVFISKLRAKLVKYHGKQPFSGWMIIGAITMSLMLLLTGLGLILRILLLLTGMMGLLNRNKREGGKRAVAAPTAIEI